MRQRSVRYMQRLRYPHLLGAVWRQLARREKSVDVTVWKVLPGRERCKSGWQASVYLFEVGEEQGFFWGKKALTPHELEVAPGCLSKTPESAWDVLASAHPVHGRLRDSALQG